MSASLRSSQHCSSICIQAPQALFIQVLLILQENGPHFSQAHGLQYVYYSGCCFSMGLF